MWPPHRYGADFDESTGQIIAGRDVLLLGEAEAQALHDRLQSATWTVTGLEERSSTRKPLAAPSPPRRCNRKQTASCACQPATRCASPRASMNRATSPTCEPTR
ncbi:hypothetical protein [Leptolyngbya sp. O-77]|uniref:hypothetical protein n=1 Tax=Leptolyngbya sp. O-77 TaxID=1080068 RepID=UPI0029395433|nr:hypothetical protein [Leptolyngbya sp. O-77]